MLSYILCSGLLTGSEQYTNPEQFMCLQNYGSEIKEIKELLKKKDNINFYLKAQILIEKYNQEGIDISEQNLINQIWLLYYVAQTPLLNCQDDSLVSEYILENGSIDIKTKTSIIHFLTDHIDSIKKYELIKGIKVNDILKLYASYFTMIIKEYKQNYLSDFSQKLTQEITQDKVDLEGNEKSVNYRNNLIIRENRNNDFKNNLEFLEKTFVEQLVRYYSKNKKEVYHHLISAGYTAKEIPALIDRTVGKDANTEFLYQGRKKKKKAKQSK